MENTMTEVVSLLPCPFCGSNELNIVETEYSGDTFCPTVTIDCRDCPCGMNLYGDDMKIVVEEITTKWNMRYIAPGSLDDPAYFRK
jgi:hypothetical protein